MSEKDDLITSLNLLLIPTTFLTDWGERLNGVPKAQMLAHT